VEYRVKSPKFLLHVFQYYYLNIKILKFYENWNVWNFLKILKSYENFEIFWNFWNFEIFEVLKFFVQWKKGSKVSSIVCHAIVSWRLLTRQ
jgi:hypothetical protein